MAVQPVPEGYQSVIPYLVVEDVGKLLAFTKAAFGAAETECVKRPDGGVNHAEVRIGDSVVMMGAARPGVASKSSTLYLYVPDVDAAYQRAMAAGGTSVMEPTNMFYGDRSGGVSDGCGNEWWLATRLEEISSEELQRRVAGFAP